MQACRGSSSLYSTTHFHTCDGKTNTSVSLPLLTHIDLYMLANDVFVYPVKNVNSTALSLRCEQIG